VAIELLDAVEGIEVVARSSVYETEPIGEVSSQPDFYNAVVQVETALEPHILLAACKRIERELGRKPGGVRHGPRPIDLDLLLVGEVTLADEELTLPHPELAGRRFVLTPLAELAPDLTLPDGSSLDQALGALGSSQRVQRVAARS
jgi:2-amino-4-hydroxy-6-hydroxymethyldihydropteridine diphosphokinase